MNAPYIPSSGILSKFNRQWARFSAKTPINIDLDHAIVTFTFDDFPKSAATLGASILEKHGWLATYYASASFAQKETHHGTMFDASDLKRLTRAGHEIGCHTYEHLDCTQATASSVIASIEKNTNTLKDMGLETPLESFAFPYGEATPSVKRLLGERFSTLRGIRSEINRGMSDRHLLKSVPLDGGEAGIKKAMEAAEGLTQDPGWLIYYAHDVRENPTEWGCTPDQLEEVCQAVERSGARVLTMSQAYGELEHCK